jgi:hypothetical protein
MNAKFRYLVIVLLLLSFLAACSNKPQDSESELLGTLQALQTQVGQQEAGTPQSEATVPPSELSETPPPVEGSGEGQTGNQEASPLMRLIGLSLLGQIGGSSYAVAVEGNYAYLGVGPRLVVLDISDPGSPKEVGQSRPLHGIIMDVQVSKGYAYVAAEMIGGLHVIDVSDPTNPQVMSEFIPEQPGCNGLALWKNQIYVENLVYLACNPYGLRIVDVSDPANPQELSGLNLKTALTDIAILDGYAYLNAPGQGIYVVDIHESTQPVQVSYFPAPPGLTGEASDTVYFNALDALNGYLYVSCGDAGLAVIDIQDPTNLQLVGSLTANVTNGITVRDNIVYLVDEFEGVRVMDVSNPVQPLQVGLAPTAMGTENELTVATRVTRNIAVSGDFLFVTDTWHSLFIYNVSDPANPIQVSHYQAAATDRLVDVKLSGTIACMVGDSSGLRVIDVSDPAKLQELAFDDQRIDLYLQTPSALHISGDFGYISDNNSGFRVYDLHDPSNPVLNATILDIGFVNDMWVSGDYAYLASVVWKEDDTPRLLTVNVQNPSNPQIVNQVDIPLALEKDHTAWVMSGEGEYLYLLDIANVGSSEGSGYIFSLANPAQPEFSSHYTLPAPLMGGGSLLVDGVNMYTGSIPPPLMVMDLTNPVQPVPAGMNTMYSAGYDLHVYKEHLYTANAYGLTGFNLATLTGDPAQAMTAFAWLPSHTFALTVDQDRLYAVGLDFGLYVFKIE